MKQSTELGKKVDEKMIAVLICKYFTGNLSVLRHESTQKNVFVTQARFLHFLNLKNGFKVIDFRPAGEKVL